MRLFLILDIVSNDLLMFIAFELCWSGSSFDCSGFAATWYFLSFEIDQIFEGWDTFKSLFFDRAQTHLRNNDIYNSKLNQLELVIQTANMRRSCHEGNSKLLNAYKLYQSGQMNEALQQYQSLLDRATDISMSLTLKCTISVISSALGNYNYALEVLDSSAMEGASLLVKLRCLANLCFLHVTMGAYNEAINAAREIRALALEEIYQSDSNISSNEQMVSFILQLFFRADSIQQIQTKIETEHFGTTLADAFYLLNCAIAKDLLSFNGSIELLKHCYPIFISYKKYCLALATLRQLLLSPLPNKDQTKFQKQMSKLMSMDFVQGIEYDNREAIESCKIIAQEIIDIPAKMIYAKKANYDECQIRSQQQNCQFNGAESIQSQLNMHMWDLVLRFESRKLMSNASIAEEEKNTIVSNIALMRKQVNPLVVNEMMKSDFYRSAEREIKNILQTFSKIHQSQNHCQIVNAFKQLAHFSSLNKHRITLRNKSQVNVDSQKHEKQNQIPLSLTLTRDRSSKSLTRYQASLAVNSELQPNKLIAPLTTKSSKTKVNVIGPKGIDSKLISKMVKFCEYGSFMNKRNFNSDGGEYRFVRVTQSILKWAKNPQKIEESHQFYPLKDISSIVYGKQSPTLMKHSNHLLSQQFCFSLCLRKRTLDFYCKDFEQTCNWVIGLTHKLKQTNPSFRGYTQGRLLWKRMFILLKEKYTRKISAHERKYYYQTAHAIILFGKDTLNKAEPVAKSAR